MTWAVRPLPLLLLLLCPATTAVEPAALPLAVIPPPAAAAAALALGRRRSRSRNPHARRATTQSGKREKQQLVVPGTKAGQERVAVAAVVSALGSGLGSERHHFHILFSDGGAVKDIFSSSRGEGHHGHLHGKLSCAQCPSSLFFRRRPRGLERHRAGGRARHHVSPQAGQAHPTPGGRHHAGIKW